MLGDSEGGASLHEVFERLHLGRVKPRRDRSDPSWTRRVPLGSPRRASSKRRRNTSPSPKASRRRERAQAQPRGAAVDVGPRAGERRQPQPDERVVVIEQPLVHHQFRAVRREGGGVLVDVVRLAGPPVVVRGPAARRRPGPAPLVADVRETYMVSRSSKRVEEAGCRFC